MGDGISDRLFGTGNARIILDDSATVTNQRQLDEFASYRIAGRV